MRNVLLATLLVLAGCSKKKDEPPAPAPKPEATETKPEVKPQVKPEATACVVKVDISDDDVDWNGGGVKGSGKLASLDLSPLKALAGKNCDAVLTANLTTKYRDVIKVMDVIITSGIPNVALGNTKSSKPSPPRGVSDLKMEIKPDGTIVGTMPAKPDLKSVPIVIMMKTGEVKIGGKEVGTTDSASLKTDVAAALVKPKIDDPTIVIQADASLTYEAVVKVVDGAAEAGYSNVLFAITSN